MYELSAPAYDQLPISRVLGSQIIEKLPLAPGVQAVSEEV